MSENEATQHYISAHSKSKMTGFLLTLFLGPLGLFYSSWVAALILCVLAVVSAATIIGPIVCWLLAILISAVTINGHNDKVVATAGVSAATKKE